jgi:hypothetical protein
MGGKGGGGNEEPGWMPAWRAEQARLASEKETADAAARAAAAAEPEAAPVTEAPAQEAAPNPLANMPAAPATDTTVAPPASLGGTPAPGAGDSLGGAVLKPPRYWTGGLDQYESAHRTGRGGAGAGSIRTTQT